MDKRYVVKVEIIKSKWIGYVSDWKQRENGSALDFQFLDNKAIIFEDDEVFDFISDRMKNSTGFIVTKEYLREYHKQ